MAELELCFLMKQAFRISKPKSCWMTGKIRLSVPCPHVREYRYAYGAVDPFDGENFFIAAPRCNRAWTHAFFLA